MAIPGPIKMRGSSPKQLLVNALNGALPETLVQRPKRGFTLPFEHWMRDTLRPEIESTLKRIGTGPLNGLLDPHGTRHVWAEFLNGQTSWSRPWSLFVLQRWCEQNV
jgi:asparagine synthase (glutamine-hydrolysing)